MIVYGVCVWIDRERRDEWLKWMLEKHIPDVIASGYFRGYFMYEVLEAPSEDETAVAVRGRTAFRILYECESREKLAEYARVAAPALQAEHAGRYGGHFHAEREVLGPIGGDSVPRGR